MNTYMEQDTGLSPAIPAKDLVKDEAPEVAKYTDKQLNDLIAKNAGKASEKTRAEILAELGADSIDTLKARLAKQAEAEKAGMTEAEKYKAELEAEKKARLEEAGKRTAAELRAEIIGKGVPADKADKVAKLAAGYDGETIAAKVEAVLAEFPEFVKPQAQQVGIEGRKSNLSEEDALLSMLGSSVGLQLKK
jgi:phage protein D